MLTSSRKPTESANTNLVEITHHWAKVSGDARAFAFLSDGENCSDDLTYAQFDRRCRAIAAHLQQAGLAGKRALLAYPPGLAFITAYVSCLYAKVAAVPTYPPRRRAGDRFRTTLLDADAAIVLTSEGMAPRLAQHMDGASLTILATDTIDEAGADQWSMPDLTPDTVAMVQYTSGSTATPRGVVVTQSNLMHNLACMREVFGISGKHDVGVTWLPPHHDMGLIGSLLMALYVGGPNIILPPMSVLQKPMRWLSAITKYRGTITGGPNFIYDLCVQQITAEQRAKLDLSTWQVACNGAEPVRAETLSRFSNAFADCGFGRDAFLPCYGLAEATLMVAGQGRREPQITRVTENTNVQAVSCGPPMPDHQVWIVDPETRQPKPGGQIGEIWTTGPSIASGYFNQPEATANTFGAHLADGSGPYLRTGDLGFMRDGELYCTGRQKELIIVRGVNYFPHDIEQTARASHELLANGVGAAFSIEQDGSERAILVHEVERNHHRSFEDVLGAITKAVSEHHELSLDAVVLVRRRTIHRTTSGKVQRRACADAFANGELNIVAQYIHGRQPVEAEKIQPDRETTSQFILQQAQRLAPPTMNHIDLDTPLSALGLDSLQRLELLASIEKSLGITLPDVLASEAHTFGELARLVEQRQHAAAAHTAQGNGKIPPEHYQPDQFPEYTQLKGQLAMLDRLGQANPYFQVHQGMQDGLPVIDGQPAVSFSHYDYLGMSVDPEVHQAAKQAIDQFGTSASASRLVFGEKTIHGELERKLAQHYGVDDALVFVSGHATNVTTIGHLFDHHDLIMHDEAAHNSITQGALLSGATRRPFPHNDWHSASDMLQATRGDYRRVLLAIEGVYSMDGDMPDLPRFVEVAKQHHTLLMVDEAHALGTVGQTGRGTLEHYGIDGRDVDLWMGTLSKTLASCGGYIAGSTALVDYLKYTAPGFVYSVGMPPANVATALASLRKLHAEPHKVDRVHELAQLFRQLATERGLNIGLSTDTPIVPVITGSSLRALQASHHLMANGIHVSPILYPAVPDHAARLRFFITSRHTPQQVQQAVTCLADFLTPVARTQAGVS